MKKSKISVCLLTFSLPIALEVVNIGRLLSRICLLAVQTSIILFLLLGSLQQAMAQPTQPVVKSLQKISSTQGGFAGSLSDNDSFGQSVASIGDLDGDGVSDAAVGAPWDDDGGTDRGAVWILFLNQNGTVKSSQKISSTQGGLTSNVLNNLDGFGFSAVSIGDLDGDGVTELAVGAPGDDTGWTSAGAVWILFLNQNGTVKSTPIQKISPPIWAVGAFLFGYSTAPIGDLNGDGVPDLAVSTPYTSITHTDQGAVWILFLNANGTLKSSQIISSGYGGFGTLISQDRFGSGVTSIGDIDGDGVSDLAVGAEGDDDGGAYNSNRGALWILFLNQNGTVKSYQKISTAQGGFTGPLVPSDEFGQSVASMGDLDGDGVVDVAVGASNAVWTLFLNANGMVKSHRKIISGQEGFTGTFQPSDPFGHPVASLSDLNGDGVKDLAIGAPWDDDGGADRGAVLILFTQSPEKILSSDIAQVSVRAGGTQILSIDAGLQNAGKNYFVVGAFSTTPPIQSGNFTIPLAADGYFNMTVANQNSWHLVNSLGVLDSSGRAVTTVVWPQGLPAALIGTRAFHVVVVHEPNSTLRRIGGPTQVTFVP